MYQIIFLESQVTVLWDRAKCERIFGVVEFMEILEGYYEVIVAVEV